MPRTRPASPHRRTAFSAPGPGQGQRLLAEDVLAGRHRGLDLRLVEGVRGGENDRLDAAGRRGRPRRRPATPSAWRRGEGAAPSASGSTARTKRQRRRPRLDEVGHLATPPAEADDRRMNGLHGGASVPVVDALDERMHVHLMPDAGGAERVGAVEGEGVGPARRLDDEQGADGGLDPPPEAARRRRSSPARLP